MAPIGNAVFATLLMNDAYLPGAMVLGHSLKDRGAKARLVVFVVAEKLANSTITELKTIFDDVVPVQQIVNRTPANLYLMQRPDLISTFTKIELWKQLQYKRIVYIDADVVALRAPNELLTLDTQFAAVPDIGWPDCFNSGMMVLNPNMADYYALLALAERGISFDGADQGLLNMHFTEWERLSFAYNCTPSGNYQYVPAYRHFQSSISMVHFIGSRKPWHVGRNHDQTGGVYGELLGRWWAVFDRHYRGQETVYYTGSWQGAPKKVQDYVSGEETIYLPGYQAPQSQRYGVYHHGQPPSSISVQSPPSQDGGSNVLPSVEQPFGDQPPVEEQIRSNDFKPTPTAEQRRWSAPHVEWEPSRAPPPTNSKPEASNFPSTIYEMSESKELFRPPSSYPEAPKDMWYQVPEKVAPPPKPKPIFPWEHHAPKPTRVFAEPQFLSPPPEPVIEPAETSTTSDAAEPAPDQTMTPLANTDGAADSKEFADIPKEPYVDPWTTFNQRTNAWDDVPEITKYMQAFTGARKAKIQVLHHTPSTSKDTGGLLSPSASSPRRRRESLIITDFPTVAERPSLPVTPAPIKRSTIWGDEGEDQSDLPAAEGVPKQNEWVRRFSSYPRPVFNAFSTPSPAVNSGWFFKCQFCGQQNPIAKLEELQRRQSEALLGGELTTTTSAPLREMPESTSKEAVVQAAEKAMTPPTKPPLKPILKEPSFEVPKSSDEVEGFTSTNVFTSAKDDGSLTASQLDDVLSPTSTAEDKSDPIQSSWTTFSQPEGTFKPGDIESQASETGSTGNFPSRLFSSEATMSSNFSSSGTTSYNSSYQSQETSSRSHESTSMETKQSST